MIFNFFKKEDKEVLHPQASGRDIIRCYERDVLKHVPDNINIHKEILGHVGSYPILYLKFGKGKKHLLVTGGVHGEEPSGTYAALKIADFYSNPKSDTLDFLKEFTFHIFPCINPYGYEHNTRENEKGIDLNRGFKSRIEGEECELFAKKMIRLNKSFVFTMDLHEGSMNQEFDDFKCTDNPNGTWLYELCHDPKLRKGRTMIDAVKDLKIPVNSLEDVYGDNCVDGLITYPDDMGSDEYAELNSFDGYLWQNYTQDAFTAETMLDRPMKERIMTHFVMFTEALKLSR